MKKLINKMFAGMRVATSKGILGFDDEGTCVVEDDVADSLGAVAGYEVVEEDSQNGNTDNTNEDTDEDTDEDSEDEDTADNTNEDSATDETEDDSSEGTDEDSEDEIDLKSLTVPALKKYAKDHGIDITGLSTKDQLLKAIQG